MSTIRATPALTGEQEPYREFHKVEGLPTVTGQRVTHSATG